MPNYNSSQKYIYVIFSRPKTIVSETIEFFIGGEYTHCSITLDKDLGHMFSFGRKYTYFPFIGCYLREELDKKFYGQCETISGKIVEVPVSDEQYANVKRRLVDFWINKKSYKYNVFGLLLFLLKKPYAPEHKYTCAQFVAETLDMYGIASISKPYTLVTPSELQKQTKGRIIFEGDIKRYARARKNNLFPISRRKA